VGRCDWPAASAGQRVDLLDASATAGLEVRTAALTPDRGRPVFVTAGGRVIGFARYEYDGSLLITSIEVEMQHRNLGYGAEAVVALEQAFGAPPRSWALMPEENGIAVYFWLRAGYRPLFASKHGHPRRTVMERLAR
jgi:hypothetical protein